jgi:hypothetical protein
MKIAARWENSLRERGLDTVSPDQTKQQSGALGVVGEVFGLNIG